MPRDLVKLYSFVAGTRSISVDEQIPFKSSDVRLIINETKHEIICSSMQKENITVSGNVITFASKFSTLDLHDEITIEIDFRLSEIVPVVPESPTTHKVIFIDPFGVVNEQWVENGTNAIIPAPRVHEYLTFVEWNQSTENVTEDRVIGATYNTTDGKTYAFITLTAVTGLDLMLYLNKNDGSTLTIDWGDGNTSTFTNSGNFNTGAHNYSVAGDYVITMWISSGSGTYSFGNGSYGNTFIGNTAQNKRNTLTKLYIGNRVTTILYSSIFNCNSLSVIVIPSNVTTIGDYALNNASLLKFVALPKTIISLGVGAFTACYLLIYISIGTNLSVIPQNGFIECYSLRSFILNTGIVSLNESALNKCLSIYKMTIPSTITLIGYNSFLYCRNILIYIIYKTTPPTLQNTSVFSGINPICKIYVPDASVSAYKTATNWATYANYIYPLSDIGE